MDQKITLYIDGMTCENCRTRINVALQELQGVSNISISYLLKTATFTYDTNVTSLEKIQTHIRNIGYDSMDKNSYTKRQHRKKMIDVLIILSAFLVLQITGILNYLAPGTLSESNTGYGVLFLLGLFTSVHCIAMCGGLHLSQILSPSNGTQGNTSWRTFCNTLEYQLGRIVSYTFIGGLLGGIGNLLGLSQHLQQAYTIQGIIKIVSGCFLVLMGTKMLGLISVKPIIFMRMHDLPRTKMPFVIGLINGLMPCGPLQTVQLIAATSGNVLSGALSMLCFALGTVPLMICIGSAISLLGSKFSRAVMHIGSLLVIIMGLSMMSQGSALSGLHIFRLIETPTDTVAVNHTAEATDIQEIFSSLSPGQYPDVHVHVGIPVEWHIQADKASINGCNNKIILSDFGQDYSFHPGDNVIQFTPTKTGVYSYTCWMGMITGKIYVEE